MAKKIINKILLLGLIAIIVSLVNVNFVFGQANCGPDLLGFDCIGFNACGFEKCKINYQDCDSAASSACFSEVGVCESNYATCLEFCYGPQAGSCIANCDILRVNCLSQAEAAYLSAKAACVTSANTFQQTFIGDGLFTEAGCQEASHCFENSGIIKFASYSKLSCDDLSVDALKKTFADNPNEALKNLNPQYKETLSQVYAENQFVLEPDVLAENMEKIPQDVFDKMGINNPEMFNAESVQSAMESKSYEFTSKEAAETVANYIKNHEGILGPINDAFDAWDNLQSQLFDEIFGETGPAVKVVLKLKSFYEFVSGFLGGTTESSTPYPYSQQQAAQNNINTPSGFTTASFSGTNTISVGSGFPQQNLALLNSNTDRVSIGSNSINVINGLASNMYTLMGENYGVENKNGIFRIDGGGTTKMSIGEDIGAFIEDIKPNLLWLAPGTTSYFGTGTEDVDVFLSDTLVMTIGAGMVSAATTDTSGDEFGKISLKKLTGAVTFKPSEGRLAESFDHFTLPNYQNAIDLGKISDGYQLLARGFGDMVLLGQDKFFPLLVRNFLKGDSAIVFNKDVKIINTYVARDNTYDYIIKADNESTKVTARNGKIIQDSSGMPLGLTPRQRSLIYAN